MGDEADWRADLDRWLEPFLAELKHAARRTMCPHYIAGLIGLGERKSMQPMAARQNGLSYDRLQHFISVGRWDDAPLAQALLVEADRMVGGRDAVLVIDDTSLPKKGRHSVGVAPQYLSTQGETGNCQAMVSLRVRFKLMRSRLMFGALGGGSDGCGRDERRCGSGLSSGSPVLAQPVRLNGGCG